MTSNNSELSDSPAPGAPAGYSLSTNPERVDFDYVHAFLSRESYWAKSITKARLRRAISHSHCFSVFHAGRQVAFARVITDYSVFAYLCDVFVDSAHRGRGVGKWLIRSIVEQPDLGEIRRWILGKRDAHELYAQNGFTKLKAPETFMEKFDPETYAREGGER